MIRPFPHSPRTPERLRAPCAFAGSAVIVALVSSPRHAAAQAPPASPIPDVITVGAWTFRPTLEVRLRAEYRRHPFDAGGDQYDSSAVLAEAYGSTLPTVTTTQTEVKNQYYVTERARLGLAVDRGPVTAAVSLQDARVWGDGVGVVAAPGEPTPSVFAPNEAYLDVHTRTGRRVFLRAGRQMFTWGDGRLLGANDWSVTGRSLDAARFGFQAGDVDVEMFGAMLSTPGQYGPSSTTTSTTTSTSTSTTTLSEGSGTQLYGLNAMWHIHPLARIEATGFARVVREPVPTTLTAVEHVRRGRAALG